MVPANARDSIARRCAPPDETRRESFDSFPEKPVREAFAPKDQSDPVRLGSSQISEAQIGPKAGGRGRMEGPIAIPLLKHGGGANSAGLHRLKVL